MNINLNIPTNYHIPLSQLTGIEKLRIITRGEGKYLVELLWHGRDVSIEVHLKNKQLTMKKAEEVIQDNLTNLFGNLMISSEWAVEDKKVNMIWNEHMNELAVLNQKTNAYFYKHFDKDMKDKMKKELKALQKEKEAFERTTRSPRQGINLIPLNMPNVDQKIIRLRMALELDHDKIIAKRHSVDNFSVRKPEMNKRASLN